MKWVLIGGAVVIAAIVLWAVLGRKARAADKISSKEEARTLDFTFSETPSGELDLVLESMRDERNIGRSIAGSPVSVGGVSIGGTVRF